MFRMANVELCTFGYQEVEDVLRRRLGGGPQWGPLEDVARFDWDAVFESGLYAGQIVRRRRGEKVVDLLLGGHWYCALKLSETETWC